MGNVLETNSIRKSYSKSSFVLNDINLHIPEGEIVGLVGKNGAGKTTLISLILNQISADSGTIKMFDSQSESELKKAKENMGFVIDECCYHDCLSSSEIGDILKSIYHLWNTQSYNHYLQRFEIDPKKSISALSKGMKSKLMLAAALAHSPKLLILDEVTSGLDPIARDEILHLLKDYVKNTSNSVLFSTHITSDLDKIADRVIFLHNGNLVFEKAIETLRNQYILYKCLQNSTPIPEEDAIIAQYTENNKIHFLLDKNKTRLEGVVPSLDDIMLLHIKGR